MADADTLGNPIPPDTAHAVSVSLPKWRDNVGYEEGEERVVSRMQTGYPRFFIHKSIVALAHLIVQKHGAPGQHAMLFASHDAALRCQHFLRAHSCDDAQPATRILDFVPTPHATIDMAARVLRFSALLYPAAAAALAKSFWQHTGEGISSRRAEYCRAMFDQAAFADAAARPTRGPRRYQKEAADGGRALRDSVLEDGATDNETDQSRFVEERYGRNLDLALAEQAKLALRRRIAGSLAGDADPDESQSRGVSTDDVFLFPGGMNAIYTTHRILLGTLDGSRRSICFGFPYIDTLKLLEKFGAGALFYGHGSAADLDDLEARLAAGERFLALFCEFPSNPLLRTPDLRRIRALADAFDFAVVVDETVGNYLNVDVLPLADVLVSSLTKLFSGDSNVMGGAAVLNPRGRHAAALRAAALATAVPDTLWPEDALFLERNSRDFATRAARVNANAALIAGLLAARPAAVEHVFYPATSASRAHYDAARRPGGGYGGLLSATFRGAGAAARFFDALDVHKGPSLGTNFTLASPFVILAHYGELEWAAGFGVPSELVRFSVGLESEEVLREVFGRALDAVCAETDEG